MDEQTDRDTLDTLQTLAIELLDHKETRSQGETLWKAFTYLEGRLSRVDAGQGSAPAALPAGEIPATIKEVMKTTQGQVYVFLNCRIETVTLEEGG